MKNILSFLSLSLLLTGCATLGGTSYAGQDFDSYVVSHGIPTSQYTLQDGSIAYSFHETCEYDFSRTGETLVIVGTDNLIQSVSTPTRCPYYYETDEYKYQQQIKQDHNKRIRQLESKLLKMNNGYPEELSLKLAEQRVGFKEEERARNEERYNLKKKNYEFIRSQYYSSGPCTDASCSISLNSMEQSKAALDQSIRELNQAKEELRRAQQNYRDWERQKRELEREIRELKARGY